MNESLKVKTDNAEITTEKKPASNIEIAVCILLGILSLVCGILIRFTVNSTTRPIILKFCEIYSWVGIWGAFIGLYCGFCLIRYNKELIKETHFKSEANKENNSENKEQE